MLQGGGGHSRPGRAARGRHGVKHPLLWTIGGPVFGLCIWELAAKSGLEQRRVVPSPTSVFESLLNAGDLLSSNVPSTLATASLGFLWGVGLALAFGLVCAVSRNAERIVIRGAIITHSLPTIALAPILLVVSTGRTPGVVMAAMSTFFLTLVNFVAGLASTPDIALEMNHAFGGSRAKALFSVRLRYALPSLFAGLMLSAPAALVGALMSEFLIMGTGLGAALIAAQESLDTPRVWAISLVAAAISAVAYVMFDRLGKFAAPWRAELSTDYRRSARSARPWQRVALGGIVSTVFSTALFLGIWVGLIHLFNLNSYFAKGPADVWAYLVSGPDAWDNLTLLLEQLGNTLTKATLGLLLGTLVALTIAGACVVSRRFSLAVVPSLVAFRAVPVLALIPVVSLLARDGYLTAILIAALLSFFTTVVNVIDGARGVPRDILDLGYAYNIAPMRFRWYVHRLYATPALFTSLKVTAPLALVAAMSAEWLVTGDGMGHLMIIAGMQTEYTQMWSAFVVLTIASIMIYGLVVMIERAVLARLYGGQSAPRRPRPAAGAASQAPGSLSAMPQHASL